MASFEGSPNYIERTWLSPLAGCALLTALLWGAPARAGQDRAAPAAGEPTAASQSAGNITGRIVDPTGVGIAGAIVKLTGGAPGSDQQALSDSDGRFQFAHASPGPIHLIITSAGFAAREFSAALQPAGNLTVPDITLPVATVMTEIHVTPPTFEIAEEQIKEQEKQKALGFIPNFYVTYVSNAAPLAPRQKFELAWKTMIDPMTFGITGAVAGIQQAQNDFGGYGQGADGYAKRYGAAYADAAIGTMIGGAILPSLFKQDPRYFYKGTGTIRSRFLYAIANAVVCKGDNGKWQANYYGLLGGLAAGGISNLYYPASDRDAGLTFQNFAIGIGAAAAANVLQEFVVKKLTPNLPDHDPSNGSSGGKARNLVSRAFSSRVREGD